MHMLPIPDSVESADGVKNLPSENGAMNSSPFFSLINGNTVDRLSNLMCRSAVSSRGTIQIRRSQQSSHRQRRHFRVGTSEAFADGEDAVDNDCVDAFLDLELWTE